MRPLAILIAALAVPLSAAPPASYVGKYPSNPVGSTSFLSDPAIVRAVTDAVRVPSIVVRILQSGVETPITADGLLVVANICEPHNCSDLNRAIVVDAAASRAAVCTHDAASADKGADWFVRGQIISRTAGDCTAGIPQPVRKALTN